MKKEVIVRGKVKGNMTMGGTGLVVTGFISLAAWAFGSASSVCNCPAIPVNATAQQIANICPCPSVAFGFLPVGLLAIILGGAILLSCSKLQKLCVRLRRKQKRSS